MLKTIHHGWLALVIGGALAAGPAFAKNEGHGGGNDKGDKHAQKQEAKADKHAQKQHEKAAKHARKDVEKANKHAFKEQDKAAKHARRDDDRTRTQVLGAAPRRHEHIGTYFNDDHRRHARDYYVQHYGSARSCPPGLAKKNNGCLPPGQAKKTYVVGQPLPTYVQYYSVPQQVITYLPPPPPGYRYVRVYDDVMLMSIQDRIIIDVIRNLLG